MGRVIYKKDYEIQFPKRYKIDSNGSKEVYMNAENKFDIDRAALDEMLDDLAEDNNINNKIM